MDTAHQKIIWHTNILPPATRKALDYLSHESWLRKSKWYLAGGTALTLQVGHRASVDLDFFTPQKDFAGGKLVSRYPKDIWATDILREGTIYGRLLDAKISFIAYPFFVPRRPFVWFGNVRMLDPRDIAVMKIIAISQRGRKRDFVDLYWICKNLESLSDVFRRLPDQYPSVAHDYHHIIKSFAYFDDAEADLMPRIFFDASWKNIKYFFKKETAKISKETFRM